MAARRLRGKVSAGINPKKPHEIGFSADNPYKERGNIEPAGGAAVQNSDISYCKRDVMSMCTAESRKQQRRCRDYKKSEFSEKCMYFVFDQYCDCLTAQCRAVERCS